MQLSSLMFRILFCSFPLLILGCSNSPSEKPSSKEKDAPVVARAYGEEFTADELRKIMPDKVSEKDSTRIASDHIRNWLKEQVMLRQAEQTLTGDQKDMEEKLRDYRNSLLIYEFQKQFIRNNLDTLVRGEEIREYYEKNKKNFQLKDYIVKAIYVVVDTGQSNAPDLRGWMLGITDPDRRRDLENFCREKALHCSLDDSSWAYFDDLLREVPLEVYNRRSFLQNNHFARFRKEGQIYYLRITEHELKGGVSPLAMERKNIRAILINKRKKNLIDSLQEGLMKQARKRKNVQVFE